MASQFLREVTSNLLLRLYVPHGPPGSQQAATNQDATIGIRKDLYGVSNADVNRILVVSGVYQLPFGHGQAFGSHWNRFMEAVFGGYQVNGIFSAHTGNPLSISASNVARLLNPGEQPNWNGQYSKVPGRVENKLGLFGLPKYFVTTNFSQPANYTFGNMAATSGYLRGPGLRNVDFFVVQDV